MINIILFGLYIGFSAFFSASETALFSLTSPKVRRLEERYAYQGKLIKQLLTRPARLLTTVNFGNMLVNTGISALFTALFVAAFGDKGLFFSILTSTAFILILGEILPKTMAIYMAERIALWSVLPLNFLSFLFRPLIYLIEKISFKLSPFLGGYSRKGGYSPEELKTALSVSRQDGLISEAEEEMLSHVLEFKDTWVADVLTARTEIFGIDSRLNQAEVLNFIKEKKHSKFPVYENSLDNIVGILYSKDVFLNLSVDYHKLLRLPVFVPESRRIDDLLKTFLETQERVAVVLDEYGGTSGIVTLEDIEEELFGEIYDEFEVAREAIEQVDAKTYRVLAKTSVKEVNLELELELPEEEATLAGFLLSRFEHIPKVSEHLEFDGAEFIIERATAKRVVSVLIKLK